ncbi:Asp-tRNA(Asn)/Glu-tRNA(Gln) amidotransferase subunit GatA [Legionella jordanis]|uniref:Asp-tRNA(Asn)/Glu-tRNA(Gln) amidotransferase subunit GatA n=1 Tax=Legionella jordanis TaxID=456 RepID=UPI000EFDFB9D|nr:Asp-tRNA(Asn)/Glu-tRNA(Gln) amidotransferase subunit GatA [Legionella jordanis]RMX18734.1 Asp-tRNA(Asn)/Glu-tRNA(Gln) amidotransferase subunit GatA [Legionella jordanis]HAT8713038.1 Asp-tRNA(Asn)/Glu-tRNA(Gln) amidotransferase subunit GatA [Legionella jordanis]
MHNYSIKELSLALQQRDFSSVELTKYFLSRIAQHKNLNAFISLDEEQALTSAARADQMLKEEKHSHLTGIPMAHKDIFCTQRLPTTCGSKMLANFKSPYQATVAHKLEEQGAVMIGKTNMDEFGMGSSNEFSYFGPVKNPWNLQCVSGGSSGGSAAAVAAALVSFATGSDTGGSIRQPSAFCGISGIKPTYGLLSRFGLIAYASSLDQAGPIARSAEDLAFVLQAMAGFDAKDSTSVNRAIPDYSKALNRPIKGLRLGLPTSFLSKDVDIDIRNSIQNSVKILEQEGAQIIDLELSLQSLWVPCYYVIACAEASSNLARYDGIRYGHRSTKGDTLRELISNSRMEGFGIEVKRRILTGTHVLSSGYFDAYYLQALKIRRLIQLELQTTLKQVDIILGPTTPTCAFTLGNHNNNPVQNYLADVFTVSANLAGLPAISIPAGFSAGLPIGMQMMANYFQEELLLNVAHHYQQCTDWHQARPTYKG